MKKTTVPDPHISSLPFKIHIKKNQIRNEELCFHTKSSEEEYINFFKLISFSCRPEQENFLNTLHLEELEKIKKDADEWRAALDFSNNNINDRMFGIGKPKETQKILKIFIVVPIALGVKKT